VEALETFVPYNDTDRCLTPLTHTTHKVNYMLHVPRIQDVCGSDGQQNEYTDLNEIPLKT